MKELIFPALNLFLLLGFIVYKTKHPFYEFMKQRHLFVFEGLNRAKTQAAIVAQKKRQVEAKLANLDALKAEITAEWKDRELAQTRAIQEGSARVIAQMQKEAAQNKQALEVSLREDILCGFRRNVLAQVETRVKQLLTPGIHAKLNQDFLSEVASGVGAS